MIYLDQAATSVPKPPQVIEAVTQAMQSLGNCSRGTYDSALRSARTIYNARETLAAFFGCPDPNRVVFTSNITESLNIALCGLLRRGDHVITTDLEHNSVLRPLYRLEEERGVSVSFVPADRQGRLDYQEFSRLLRPETRAVVTTHASNLLGNLVDIRRIGRFCREHGLIYIVDTAQTAGSFPLHMEEMGIDILCFTGHKGLLGPTGTGGLCLMPGVELSPWKVGGTGVQTYLRSQPQEYPVRLEAGTLNSHGIAGLLAGVRYVQETGLEEIHRHETALMNRFCQGVKEVDGVVVYGDFSGDRAPIVTLNIGEYDSAEVADELAEVYGIAVRSGAHCAPRLHQAMGTVERGAVRFSFGWCNTEAEVDAAIEAVRRMAD